MASNVVSKEVFAGIFHSSEGDEVNGETGSKLLSTAASFIPRTWILLIDSDLFSK